MPAHGFFVCRLGSVMDLEVVTLHGADALGKTVMCESAHTFTLRTGFEACLYNALFPLLPYFHFLPQGTQKHEPASRSFWHQLPRGMPSSPCSSIHPQRHLFFMPRSINDVSSPSFTNLASIVAKYYTPVALIH